MEKKCTRKHAWHFALLAGVAVGSALMLVEGLSEGMPDKRVIMTIFSIYISMEGAAILIGYLLLDQFLGIIRI